MLTPEQIAMANMLGGMPPKPQGQAMPKGMMALGAKQPLGAMAGPQPLPTGGGLPVQTAMAEGPQFNPFDGRGVIPDNHPQQIQLPNPDPMAQGMGQVLPGGVAAPMGGITKDGPEVGDPFDPKNIPFPFHEWMSN